MLLGSTELDAIRLTVTLATVTTLILLILGTPLAWWLARQRGNVGALIEALVATPLILPPTVLGFYLLLLLAPDTAIGGAWQALTGTRLAFSFSALVIGSVIYSLPFVVQPLQSAFRRIPAELLQAAATLGRPPQTSSAAWSSPCPGAVLSPLPVWGSPTRWESLALFS